MQILLAILIATAASQVQSAGFVCSKFPLLSNLYSSAQEIFDWNISLEAPKTSTYRTLLQHMVEYIIYFRKEYEKAENEDECIPILCSLNHLLLPSYSEDWKIETYIPQEYRVTLENYVDQVGRGVYNLSSEYCQAAGKKIQEIVDLAVALDKKLSEIDAMSLCDFDYDWARLVEGINAVIIDRFEGAEKIKCRYLNPEKIDCIAHDFVHSECFNKLPQALQKHINYFLENCTKIKHELESLKGPGMGCY